MRFDLEGTRPAVAEVNDAGVLLAGTALSGECDEPVGPVPVQQQGTATVTVANTTVAVHEQGTVPVVDAVPPRLSLPAY